MMVTENDFVVVRLDDEEIEYIMPNVKAATIGGYSHIRKGDDRRKTVGGDNLTGQLCEYAIHKYFWKDKNLAMEYYQKIRDERNANPYAPDNGHDLCDGEYFFDIDVKGTRLRYKYTTHRKAPLGPFIPAIKNTLLVPAEDKERGKKSEWRPDWIYIAAFCGKLDDETPKNDAVVLAGWVFSEQIKKERDWRGYGPKHWDDIRNISPMSTLTEDLVMAQRKTRM